MFRILFGMIVVQLVLPRCHSLMALHRNLYFFSKKTLTLRLPNITWYQTDISLLTIKTKCLLKKLEIRYTKSIVLIVKSVMLDNRDRL
ncbi:hypothetical protein HHI36_005529 [Cryptolaemus montrouzieri]|uniref:Secreted protein n=1 Tax=Cryptolaemus montrouzieri TaxID=559131 RepID=A0ABD2NVA3_9CUCU